MRGFYGAYSAGAVRFLPKAKLIITKVKGEITTGEKFVCMKQRFTKSQGINPSGAVCAATGAISPIKKQEYAVSE
ncbi:MAG: hypothetical protein PHP13_01785 [Methanomicrobium sp.]|nr:hypothetical protein [Methanomicrobium sp.]